MGVGCDGRGMFGTTHLPSQPKGGRGKIAVSRLFIQKRAGLFSPARLYTPTSAVGVNILLQSEFYLSQMRESSFGMFRSDVGVARFTMLNGFVQMLNPFSQMRVFASPLSIVQRLFRMCHEHLSMTLF